jgi:hypothetical protein
MNVQPKITKSQYLPQRMLAKMSNRNNNNSTEKVKK